MLSYKQWPHQFLVYGKTPTKVDWFWPFLLSLVITCLKHTLSQLGVSIISEATHKNKKTNEQNVSATAPAKASSDEPTNKTTANSNSPTDFQTNTQAVDHSAQETPSTAEQPLSHNSTEKELNVAAPPDFVNDFDDPAIPLDVLDSPNHEHLTLREWIQLREAQRQQRRAAEKGLAAPETETDAENTASEGTPSTKHQENLSSPEVASLAEAQLEKTDDSASKTARQLPPTSVPTVTTPTANPTATTKPSRDYSFDNIRAVLIFLVIFGHAIEYFRLVDPVAEFIYVFIYLFHMPVFIFISGYFSKNLPRGRETAVRNFLLPYLLLNVVLTLIMLALGKIDEFAILNPGWTLWYLYCMFIWRLLLPDLVRIRHVLIVSFLVAILSGFLTEFGTYMALARTLGFLPFFLAGYYCQPRHIERIRHFPFRRVISLIVAGVGLLTATLWSVADLPPEILWGDRAYDLIGIPLWQSLLADILLAILSFAFIFVFITLAKNHRRFYTIWGQNTLAIYLLHVYLVAPLVQAGEQLAASRWGATGSWFGTPALEFLLLLLGSVLILWLLSRPIVSRGVAKGLDKVTGIVMRRGQE